MILKKCEYSKTSAMSDVVLGDTKLSLKNSCAVMNDLNRSDDVYSYVV